MQIPIDKAALIPEAVEEVSIVGTEPPPSAGIAWVGLVGYRTVGLTGCGFVFRDSNTTTRRKTTS